MKASTTLEEFTSLLAGAKRSAVHLELRDAYAVGDPSFEAWRQGRPYDRTEREAMWHRILGEAIGRGVTVRRARIVSEPVSDYIAYEHAITASTNLAAGEQVRWLPRHRACDLAVPPCDYWLFDSSVVQWNHFSGDGEWAGTEVTSDPATALLCANAFEAVWDRGVDHEDFRPAR